MRREPTTAPVAAEVLRGLGRVVFLTLLAVAALVMRSSESDPGNRLFLLLLAVLLGGVALWGLWQSYSAVRALRRGRPAR